MFWIGLAVGVGLGGMLASFITYKIIEYKLSKAIRKGLAAMEEAEARGRAKIMESAAWPTSNT